MIETLNELYEPRNKQLREDVNGIGWNPPCLIGPHRLVGINVKERILYFRQPHQERPFCFVYVASNAPIPPKTYSSVQTSKVSSLSRCCVIFRAVIWLFLRSGQFEELFHVPA